MGARKDRIKVFNMTCNSCERRVENEIKALNGVIDAKASFSGQYADVEYDPEVCPLNSIKDAVKKAGYSTEKRKNYYNIIGIGAIGIIMLLLGLNTGGFNMDEKLNNASYLVLFIVGVLTSIHCVGMCGGIMLSQSILKDGLQKESGGKFSFLKPALLYNAGRVVSYTVIGGIAGALGSVFSMSLGTKAALQIFAGVFMVVMGLNMAGFSLFRKLNIKLPWVLCTRGKNRAPFIVGLLNGLMPCGPLQTMQIYALGAGSLIKGALSMLLFSLGTVPLMFVFGAVSQILSKGYARNIVKLSGILVIILGIIMGTRGFALSGIDVSLSSLITSKNADSISGQVVKPEIEDGVQVVRMTADNYGYSPNVLYVQKYMPVKWVIDGKELTYCNNAVVIPSMDKQLKLKSGENIIEFTPEDKDIGFSCWMGMIRGVIRVVDNLNTVDPKADSSLPPASSPGCCSGPPVSSAGPSIYEDDISKVPTDRLVKKAEVNGKSQSTLFKGNGYEFEPLIVVVQKDINLTVKFDFNSFDDPEGEYDIVDVETIEPIASFTGNKDGSSFDYIFHKTGGYGILKGNVALGVIEVVDDLNGADLDAIREKYIR